MIGINVISPNDRQCVESLKQYKILHTKSERIFDRLAVKTARMLNVPLVMINFVDNQKVWELAEQEGISDIDSDSEISISSIAIQKDSIAKFETITKNPGLILNPMFLGELGLKFFASAAITTNGGLNVGTVCVVDSKSRDFSSIDRKKLDEIASRITTEMNKRILGNAVD